MRRVHSCYLLLGLCLCRTRWPAPATMEEAKYETRGKRKHIGFSKKKNTLPRLTKLMIDTQLRDMLDNHIFLSLLWQWAVVQHYAESEQERAARQDQIGVGWKEAGSSWCLGWWYRACFATVQSTPAAFSSPSPSPSSSTIARRGMQRASREDEVQVQVHGKEKGEGVCAGWRRVISRATGHPGLLHGRRSCDFLAALSRAAPGQPPPVAGGRRPGSGGGRRRGGRARVSPRPAPGRGP